MNETSDTDTTSATNGVANGAVNSSANETPKEAPKEAGKTVRKEARKGASKEDAPVTEAPKAESPTTEVPKAKVPKTEALTEAPKVAAPEMGIPKTEAPRGLRLRMKVWTDPTTSKRYLVPSASVSDPRLGTMTAYAMTDEDTRAIRLTPFQWNALPFFYFQEDGPAPRASARPST